MRKLIRLAVITGVVAAFAAFVKQLLTAPETVSRPEPADAPAANGAGRPTRAELYEEAQRLSIEGRSKMNKQELERAVRAARR